MKKIFGGLNITWTRLVIFAIIIGISVGLLNSVPFLRDTTVSDIATYFDFWILCGNSYDLAIVFGGFAYGSKRAPPLPTNHQQAQRPF